MKAVHQQEGIQKPTKILKLDHFNFSSRRSFHFPDAFSTLVYLDESNYKINAIRKLTSAIQSFLRNLKNKDSALSSVVCLLVKISLAQSHLVCSAITSETNLSKLDRNWLTVIPQEVSNTLLAWY